MSEREAPEFKSVDSFSQLPFIRPSSRDKNPGSSSAAAAGSAIRVFGIDFAHEPAEEDQPSSKTNGAAACGGSNGTNRGAASGATDSNSRKFECHYCCRNFPTSQALGGHQNAHKRERQHAKRAHLQSAMAAAAAAQTQFLGEAGHIYGLLDYHRLVDPMASALGARFGAVGHSFEPVLHSYYPPWHGGAAPGSAGLVGARFYGGYGSVSRTIDGSPLPGTWRTPVVHVGGGIPAPLQVPAVLPLMADDEARGNHGGVGGGSGSPSSTSSSPSGQLAYEAAAAGVEDHLSLDLHL